MTDSKQLEQSILALESQRAILGDTVVDSSIAILREKLATLNQSVIAQSEQAGERKLVTVMFADISGFTALSERLDPEQVRSLINACFSWLVPIIEKYGGTVEKFIGDEIMAMFGAPAAHENDAERALRASLDMMDALVEFNKKHLTSLGMHFGINTGIVVAGGLGSDGRQQYGVMGDAVNVAARLEDVSETGQIVVGPNTHRLTVSLFKFDMLPPVRVKGKSEPIPIHRLMGLKSAPESARGIAGLRSPLIGRASELAMLIETTINLKSKNGSVLSIVAEAGLGKSRLVSEARVATSESALWVEGRALSYTEGISYWVARSVLDHLIGVNQDATPADVSTALRDFAEHHLHEKSKDAFPYLARLRDVPMDSKSESTLKDLLPQTLQNRMHSAFADLIRAVADARPLVLVWEDLHWADHSSLGLLETLLSLTENLPLFLVPVFRPNEEGRTWEWHRKIAEQMGEHYRVLELSPLTQEDSALLVEHLLKIENMPEATRQLILNKSEGNPFFLEELLRSLIDTGMVLLDGNRAVATQSISQLEVPDTLQGVIAARIDRLPSEDKYTLQTASVIGRVFQQVVLGYLLQHQHADLPLESALSELQQRELIRWRGDLEYIFKHAITRDVTYNSLLIMRRKELHRATAETIEMLFPDQLDELAATLAYHYEAAESREKAAEYYTRAGDRAQQTYANLEAIAFYRAAIKQWEQLGGKDRLVKAYENLGIVLGLVGQVDDAIQIFETALGILGEDDIVTRARLYRREGNAYNVLRRVDDMMAVYERAIAVPRTDESIHEWLDLQLDRIWACYFAARVPEMMSIIQETNSSLEEHGTVSQKARWFESLVLVDLRRCRYYQLPDETLQNAKKQLEAAQSSGNRRVLGRAETILGFVHLWRDELDEAEQCLASGLKNVEAVGDVDTQFINLNYLALIYRKHGNVNLTREWASRTLILAQKAKSVFYQVAALGSLGWAEFHVENEQQAHTYLGEALVLQEKIPTPLRFMVSGPALALEVKNRNWEAAVGHVKSLLHPSQQKMSDELQSMLEEAVAKWEAGDAGATEGLLVKSIGFMKDKKLGYV